MPDLIKNFAYCKLTAAVAAADTTLPVDTLSRLPSNAELSANEFWMTVDSSLEAAKHEVIRVTGLSSSTIANGTLAIAGNATNVGSNTATAGLFQQAFVVTTTTSVSGLRLTWNAAGAAGVTVGISSDVAASHDTVAFLDSQSASLAAAPAAGSTHDLVFAGVVILQPGTVYRISVKKHIGLHVADGARTYTAPAGAPATPAIYRSGDATTQATTADINQAFHAPYSLLTNTSTITVVRGQEGTTAQSHASGTVVKSALTKAQLERVAGYRVAEQFYDEPLGALVARPRRVMTQFVSGTPAPTFSITEDTATTPRRRLSMAGHAPIYGYDTQADGDFDIEVLIVSDVNGFVLLSWLDTNNYAFWHPGAGILRSRISGTTTNYVTQTVASPRHLRATRTDGTLYLYSSGVLLEVQKRPLPSGSVRGYGSDALEANGMTIGGFEVRWGA